MRMMRMMRPAVPVTAAVVMVVMVMATALLGGSVAEAAPKPNIVFILADDLGVGDIGVYPNPLPPDQRLKTPNIDTLASEGMLFTDAYAGYSVCAPSRWTLMTGYHTGHTNVSNSARMLGKDATTVAQVLKKAGYTTALIGKWGLDGNPAIPVPPGPGFPTKHGFDLFIGQSNQVECHNYYPAWQYHNENNTTISSNKHASGPACGKDYAKCDWSGDLWTEAAVDYIANHARKQRRGVHTHPVPNGGADNAFSHQHRSQDRPLSRHAATKDSRKHRAQQDDEEQGQSSLPAGQDAAGVDAAEGGDPFFLFLSFTAPHAGGVGSVVETGVPAPRQSQGPYANETTWPEVERGFSTAVWDVDAAVGKVVNAIDSNNLGNNTLVFFASDNGAHNEGGHSYLFFNSSGFLNGFKRSIHDGGHRTGFIARWPGAVPAGTVTRQQFVFYDLLPTLADLVQADPDTLPPKLDGQSVLPALLKQEEKQPEFIYHEYEDCKDPICSQDKSLPCHFGQNVRMGNWSGVCFDKQAPCTGKAPGRFFLYDMSVDKAQEHDVAIMHPSVVQQLLSIMHDQYQKNWPNKH